MRKSKIWRGYFFVFLIITIIASAMPFLPWSAARNPLQFAYYEFLALAVSALELLGLGGYVYGRRFGSRRVWQAVLPLSVLFEVYSLILDSRIIANEVTEVAMRTMSIGLIILAYLIYVPLWLALYRYAWTETKVVERSL